MSLAVDRRDEHLSCHRGLSHFCFWKLTLCLFISTGIPLFSSYSKMFLVLRVLHVNIDRHSSLSLCTMMSPKQLCQELETENLGEVEGEY